MHMSTIERLGSSTVAVAFQAAKVHEGNNDQRIIFKTSRDLGTAGGLTGMTCMRPRSMHMHAFLAGKTWRAHTEPLNVPHPIRVGMP